MATKITHHNIKILTWYNYYNCVQHLIDRYYEWYKLNKGLFSLDELYENIDYLEFIYHKFLRQHPEYDYEKYSPVFRKNMDFLLNITGIQERQKVILAKQKIIRERNDRRNERNRIKKELYNSNNV